MPCGFSGHAMCPKVLCNVFPFYQGLQQRRPQPGQQTIGALGGGSQMEGLLQGIVENIGLVMVPTCSSCK